MNIKSRPLFQLRSLPIEMRWEVTRRNPCYCAWWKLARDAHRNETAHDQQEAVLRQAAIPILGLIGVSGEPVDPATPFEQLDAEDLNHGWLSGAVHPVTMRGLAGILLAGLPKESLGYLGLIFAQASCDDKEDQAPKKIVALQDLNVADLPGLNDYPDEPFVSINPAASERSINQSIDQLLKEWKGERELKERRARPDKYEEFLQVWDLREGWKAGVYDRTAELKFEEIAAITKRSIPTLNNQYCRAFELITGWPYSRELWWEMFGPIKLTELVSGVLARTNRPMFSPTPRPVPDSIISAPRDNEDGHEPNVSIVTGQAGTDDADVNLLMGDVLELIGLGRTDAEIGAKLELPEEAIAYLRSRGDIASLKP